MTLAVWFGLKGDQKPLCKDIFESTIRLHNPKHNVNNVNNANVVRPGHHVIDAMSFRTVPTGGGSPTRARFRSETDTTPRQSGTPRLLIAGISGSRSPSSSPVTELPAIDTGRSSPKPRKPPLASTTHFPLVSRRSPHYERAESHTILGRGSNSPSSSSGPVGPVNLGLHGRRVSSGQSAPVAVPHEIYARGERAQRKFREALAKGKAQPRTLKVMFVGRGRAGKTSTLKSLCNEAFDASEASTHGVENAVCTTERRFETSAQPTREWRRMRRLPTNDFDVVVARHVAQELRRSVSEDPQEVERERRERESITVGRPPGWSSVLVEKDGEGSSFKMPLDLVIKHMSQDGDIEDVITLQTFDFAGQEEYHMLHHIFMSNKGLYLIIFDLSLWLEAENDDRIAEESLTFWICNVHCHAPESRVLLVGTHADLLGSRRSAILQAVDSRVQNLLERNEALNSQLVVNEAEELCFFPVDNRRRGKTSSVDILRAKVDETASDICTRGFLSKPLPLYWLRYQTELSRLGKVGPDKYWSAPDRILPGVTSPCHVLPFSQVARLGRTVGIQDDGELLSVLIYLHDTGSLIFFDEEKLRDSVVLDPYWLAEAAANIFNCPRVVQGSVALARRLLERGELHVDLLKQYLWKSPRFAEHISTLVNLLLRFDLLVSSSEKDVYVVPFLLPMRSGAYEPPGEGSLSFDFHGMLSRLLPTVFPRLIASAAKTPSLRLTHSQVYKDSCTIFLGRRRICFELVPPVRPEMIAVRRLPGDEEDEEEQLPLELAKQVISLVHESTSEWLPHLSFTAGVLCPHCHHSGSPHVIDVSELSEVVICRRSHEPVTLAKASWAFHWRQEVLDQSIEEPRVEPQRSQSVEEPPLVPMITETTPDTARERRPSLPGVEKRIVPIPTLQPSSSTQSIGKESISEKELTKVGLLYFLYASPLTVDALDVRSELQLLRDALSEEDFRVEIDVRLGLSSTLLELLAHGDRAFPGAPVFLHCAMHAGYASTTHGLEPFLLLEDEVGQPQPLPRWRLLQWLRQTEGLKCPLSGVFLNCCDSEGVAGAFMEAGVPHVVCCRGRVFDGACKTFTKAFYRSLAAGRQVFSAFEYAQESVAFSPQAGLRPEAAKFLLLPRQEDVLKCPGLSVAPMARHYSATLQMLTAHALEDAKELGNVGNAAKAMKWMGGDSTGVLPGRHQHFLGRAQEMVEMARHFSRSDRARVVNVWGKAPGLGKTAMLAEFARFCIYPGRLFEGLAVWVPLKFAAPEVTPGLPPLVRASSGPRSERGDLFLEQVLKAVTSFTEQIDGRAPSTAGDGYSTLLWILRRLECQGRVLLVLDGIEDWVDSLARLCLLLGSRIHVQNSFGGMKTDNLELKPLQPKDAAQLFLYRVHRHLYWKDLWRKKDEWMKKATEWYGDNIYSKVADRSLLDTGDVPITLEREKREEVLNALAAMPLLSEFCQGIPLRIQQTAER
eukprot:symbB.v1.2.031477.t2/scaffold3659.1/size52467/1